MDKRELIIITGDPISTSSYNSGDFTLMTAKYISSAAVLQFDESKKDVFNSYSKIEHKNINYDLLDSVDNTLGSCLIRTSKQSPGTYYERWDEANVELIAHLLKYLKKLAHDDSSKAILNAIVEKYRDKQIEKLVE